MLVPGPGGRLDGIRLHGVTLRDIDWFIDCTLVETDFTRADISNADFTGADFRNATFNEANARAAVFVRTNLEDTLLRNDDLRGASFMLAEFDQAEFNECRINRETTFGRQSTYEARLLRTSDSEKQRELFESATWTYRILQRLTHQNAWSDKRYEYYHRKMSLRRRFAWTEKNYLSAVRMEASRWVTGYGQNPWRVIWSSLFVIVIFAVLYPITGGFRKSAPSKRSSTRFTNPPR